MKKTKLIILFGALLLTFACKKEDKEAAGGGSGTTSRDVFSVFLSSDYVFSWDNRNGNMTGATYTSYLGTSSGDVCECNTTFAGNQSVGTYSISRCVKTMPKTGFICSDFHTGAGANFTNANGVLTIKPTTNGTSVVWSH